jgi:glycosyltransferase involved in cell wall biosynthesis
VAAAEGLRKSETDVRIAIAGEGPLLAGLRADAGRILRDDSREPVLYPIGPVFDTRELVQLYNYADVVIGSGRGILEAMACVKPVIVLGERGEGELIDAGSVEAAAYTNFSGRHFRGRLEPPAPLPEILTLLLDDEMSLARSGNFSYEYIRSEQDARHGAEQLEKVYEQALRSPARLADFGVWIVRVFATAARVSSRLRLQRLRRKFSRSRRKQESR